MFEGLSEGSYELQAIALGRARAKPVRVTLPLAEDEPVELTLSVGAFAYGHVVDAQTQEPIPLARIFARGIDFADSVLPTLSSTISDANGEFELYGIDSGRVSIEAAAYGHDSVVTSGIELQAEELNGPIIFELQPVAPGERPKTEITGIGAVLAGEDDTLVINEIVEGAGAEAAGLVIGDRILAVDGVRVIDQGFEDAIQNIRGQAGTRATLEIHHTDGAQEQLEVERRRIQY